MRIRKCVVCGAYTLREVHCGKPTTVAHPPHFRRKVSLSIYRIGGCDDDDNKKQEG